MTDTNVKRVFQITILPCVVDSGKTLELVLMTTTEFDLFFCEIDGVTPIFDLKRIHNLWLTDKLNEICIYSYNSPEFNYFKANSRSPVNECNNSIESRTKYLLDADTFQILFEKVCRFDSISNNEMSSVENLFSKSSYCSQHTK